MTITDGFHDYGSNPTAPHWTTEQDLAKIRKHALRRLELLGASEDQAQRLIDDHDGDVTFVRAESDEVLRARIEALSDDEGFDAAAHTIDEVLLYVGDDPAKATVALTYEQARKPHPRPKLVEALTELSAPAPANDGAGNSEGGDAGAGGQPEPEPDPEPEFDVAAHNVGDVLAYVGDDVERARAVVAVENERDPNPRVKLVGPLQKLIDAADAQGDGNPDA